MTRSAFFLGSALAMFLAQTASAQVTMVRSIICIEYDKIKPVIEGRYEEKPFFEGIDVKSHALLKVFANPQTGTFTFLLMPDEKTACTLLAGERLRPSTSRPEKAT